MTQPHPTGHDDEVTLSDVVGKLWAGRGVVVALAALGLCAGLFSALMQVARTSHAMEYYVELSGIEKARYPNGTAFSPQDLLAPAVIDKLRRAALPGIDSIEIRDAFTVTFANPTTEAILLKFRQRTAGADVTVAELNTIGAQFDEELANSIQQMLRISMDFGTLGLNEGQARNVITALPEFWSEVYTTQFRVLDDTTLQGQSIIEDAGLDQAIGVIEADRTLTTMRAGLTVLANDNRLALLQTGDGQTPEDLASQLDTFDSVYLSPVISRELASNEAMTSFYINDISLEIERLNESVASLDATVNNITLILGGQARVPANLDQDGFRGTPNGLRVSDGAFGDIVELANRASLATYLTSVFERRHDYIRERAALEARLRQISESPALSSAFVDAAQERWSSLIGSYNALLTGARQVIRQRSGELHRPAIAPRKIGTTYAEPLTLFGAIGLLAGLLVGATASLVRPVRQRPAAETATRFPKEAA